MAYKKRSARKRSWGGEINLAEDHKDGHHQYDAQGSPEAKEEWDHSSGFKKGGKVEGKEGKKHLGKRARGGHVKHHHDHDGKGHTSIAVHHHNHKKGGKVERAAGGSVQGLKRGGGVRGMSGGAPFSSARHTSGPKDIDGGPGEQAPIEP